MTRQCNEWQLGLARAILLQPTGYGCDKRCLLGALESSWSRSLPIAPVFEACSLYSEQAEPG